jgi:glycerol uptake facilitator-like aquaporin
MINNLKFLISEFLGTFVFLGVIFGNIKQNTSGIIIPIPIGMSLITMIYLFGPLSGGHFNPAVSLMDYIGYKLKFWSDTNHITTIPILLLYWLAQFSAGILTMILLNFLISIKNENIIPT